MLSNILLASTLAFAPTAGTAAISTPGHTDGGLLGLDLDIDADIDIDVDVDLCLDLDLDVSLDCALELGVDAEIACQQADVSVYCSAQANADKWNAKAFAQCEAEVRAQCEINANLDGVVMCQGDIYVGADVCLDVSINLDALVDVDIDL